VEYYEAVSHSLGNASWAIRTEQTPRCPVGPGLPAEGQWDRVPGYFSIAEAACLLSYRT
jgi:hypothetical protein